MVKTDKFILRYANCWEDPEALLQSLNGQYQKQILSVASGGDNSLSLLTLQPKHLCIVDVNPIQIWLTELKVAAVKYLSREEVIQFLGYTNCNTRWTIFRHIQAALSSDAVRYFQKKKSDIVNGVIYSGNLERKMQFFSRFILPFVHSKQTVYRLIESKSAAEQIDFFNETWDNRRFRRFIAVFYSRLFLKVFAPDPDFLNYVNGNIGNHVYNVIKKHFSAELCQDNLLLNFVLLGHFANRLPHFLQEANFNTIKSNLETISYHHGFVETAVQKFGLFDVFNLSNIFEYTTTQDFEMLANALVDGAAHDAMFVYWNLMLPRKISDVNQQVKLLKVTDLNSHTDDRGFIYSSRIVEQKL